VTALFCDLPESIALGPRRLSVSVSMAISTPDLASAAAAALLAHNVFRRWEPQTALPVIGAHILGWTALAAALFINRHCGVLAAVSNATVLSIIYLVTLTASILTYRAFFHPLRHFPGPFAARLSQFWLTVLSFGGKRHETVRALHQKHGDFIRTGEYHVKCDKHRAVLTGAMLGPNELSIATTAAVVPILGPSGWTKVNIPVWWPSKETY
jgi:hypothetical protein